MIKNCGNKMLEQIEIIKQAQFLWLWDIKCDNI